MTNRFRLGAAALLALTLCGGASRAFAYECRCAWAYGGQRPADPNIWSVGDAVAPDGCARQKECVSLCNRPDDIAQSDAHGAAAVASECAARGLTNGESVDVYFEAQAADVVATAYQALGCTGWQNANQMYAGNCPGAPAGDAADAAVSTQSAASLAQLRAQVRAWAITCRNGALTDDPGKDCAYADATLFSALLCAAGETSRCADVASAQGRDGRWWGNPKSIGSSAPFSFGRDAVAGLLDYFLTLHETDERAARDQAQKWMDWVQAHGNRSCTTPAVTTRHGRPILDDRCYLAVDPALWPLVGQVMAALGVNVSNPNQASMDADLSQEESTILAQVNANASGGEALHLAAVEVLLVDRLRREYGMIELPDPAAIARRIAASQPQNPFFAYLARGRAESVAQKILSACPVLPPPATARNAERPYDWAWRRADADMAWNKSMGWDCVFAVDLLLGPAAVVPPTCAPPLTLSGGLCRCPAGTTPSGFTLAASAVCACPQKGFFYVHGACTDTNCPAGQTWNETPTSGLCCAPGAFDPANGGQCDVSCASDQVFNRAKNSCCPAGQILDANGGCAPCPNNQVSTGVGACGCAANKILQADATCACPAGSAPDAAGVCQCATAGATIVGAECVAPAAPAPVVSTTTAVSASTGTTTSPDVSASTDAATSPGVSASTDTAANPTAPPAASTATAPAAPPTPHAHRKHSTND